MKIGVEIEKIRCECELSVIDVCNAMNLTEAEYRTLIAGRYGPSVFQLIGFICLAHRPLNLQ